MLTVKAEKGNWLTLGPPLLLGQAEEGKPSKGMIDLHNSVFFLAVDGSYLKIIYNIVLFAL